MQQQGIKPSDEMQMNCLLMLKCMRSMTVAEHNKGCDGGEGFVMLSAMAAVLAGP